LEVWVHIRWLSIVNEAVRHRAERWLATIRVRLADCIVGLTETLLIARKR
jgi:hypothetical protein